jgi:hypothetical protein
MPGMGLKRIFPPPPSHPPRLYSGVQKQLTPMTSDLHSHLRIAVRVPYNQRSSAGTIPELDVTVFDSRSTVMGMGFQVYKSRPDG